MSVRQTLKLLDSVLAEHERHQGDGVVTLPIVHDALAPEEELLASVATHLEEPLVQIADRKEGAPGPITRPLAALIVERLSRARLEIAFESANERLTATFPGHPEPSEGLEVLLR